MHEYDSKSPAPITDESLQGRVLALDIGDKRIGMAISDPLGLTAQGLPTLVRCGKKKDIHGVMEIIARYGITRIVYGLPKNMDGSMGFQAVKTEDFIRHLRSRINYPCIPWDERLTTQSAHNALKESGMSRKNRSAKVDMLSAVLILQNYLDRNRIVKDMK